MNKIKYVLTEPIDYMVVMEYIDTDADDGGLTSEISTIMEGQMYDNLYYDWWNNYARKLVKGVYDEEQAVKGLENFVTNCKAILARNKRGVPRLSAKDRRFLAKYALAMLYNEGLLENKEGMKPILHIRKMKGRETKPQQKHSCQLEKQLNAGFKRML